MSFKTNNDDDQDQDQATTTLSHVGKTMFLTTTDHGSPLMEHVQHQPFENGLDEFPNHSSNSESLKRMREEQPQEEEKEEKEDETSSSSSLVQTTTHQDEAATLQALVVAISLLSIIPTDMLFLIMEFLSIVLVCHKTHVCFFFAASSCEYFLGASFQASIFCHYC